MSKAVQRRRGTTAEHTTFTGALGELTVDTTKDTVVVHDGTAAGGFPLLREDGSNSALALGSAGTPSLKFTGDPNTGLYSPGADQVAITTGGTGRLFVDASGNVGVGGSPSATLHAQTAAGTASELRVTTGSSAQTATLRFGQVGSVFWDQQITSSTGDYLLKVVDGGDAYRAIRSGTAISAQVFSTAGSERLRITSDGKVGIGTSSPGGKLQINSQDGFLFDVGAGAYTYMRFGSQAASEGVAEIAADRSAGAVFLKTGATGSALNNRLQLDAGGATIIYNQSGSERARITSGGNVGIGTSNPGTLLDVVNGVGRIRTGGKAGSNTYLRLESTDASNTMELAFTNSTNSYWTIQSVENGVSYRPLALNPSGGNVGIGTSSPTNYGAGATSLSINGSVGGVSDFYYNGVRQGFVGTLASNEMTIDTAGASIPLLLKTNNTERARIDSSGRLLVGTSTSITGASVEANSSSTAFRFANPAEFGLWRANGSAGSPTVVADGNILGRLYTVGYDGASYITAARIEIHVDGTPGTNDMPGRLVFSTTADGAASPTERMRITNGGQLLVNATTDGAAVGARLHIQSNTSQTAVSIKAGTNGTPGLYFVNAAGTKVGDIVINSDSTSYSTSGGNMLVGTATNTANGGVLQVSNGITFPATQSACSDANTLDDYEEGTWTPGIAFGGGSTGITYNSATDGRYTKIGRLVTLVGFVGLTNKGSSSGAATLTGIPFAINGFGGEAGDSAVALGYVDNLTYTGTPGIWAGSAAAPKFVASSSGSAITNLTDTAFSNSTGMIIRYTYFAS